jgi:glycosyltransferase involved in cell wall biosynthesis
MCHVPGDPLWFVQQPEFIRIAPLVGLWIAQSTRAQSALAALGFSTEMISYALDTRVFDGRFPEGETVASLRQRWGIPADKYVIGNFMRDSLGEDISLPKPQKGPDLFLAVMQVLQSRHLPFHVLLAGPRRHWLRAQLSADRVPFTFVGKETVVDDYPTNILDRSTLNLLYHAADLHLVSSRSEGGPFAILEAAGARSKVLSTPVGLAADVLEPYCLYRSFDEAAGLIERDIQDSFLSAAVEVHYERVLRNHSAGANALRFKRLYERIAQVPVYESPAAGLPLVYQKPLLQQIRPKVLSMIRRSPRLVNLLKRASRKVSRPDASRREGRGISVSLWHEFRKPPYGGGNQFMLALRGAFVKMGVIVYDNRMADDVDVHICNSVWFNAKRFQAVARTGRLRMLHRIDGPISLIRGSSRELDDQVFELNAQLATATIIQSGWCFRHLLEMGFKPVRPMIITNGVDGGIFHPQGRVPFDPNRKIRLISASWSDNPRKGGPVYQWLDEHLDWRRFEYTFVGRTQERFRHIKHVAAVPSEELADLLRQHDIYITASERDPCSNSLVEALACRLPAVYRNDGGHPEIVQVGGLPFEKREEIPERLERLITNYHQFQSVISIQSIDEIAKTYLSVIKQMLEIIPLTSSDEEVLANTGHGLSGLD